MTELNYGNELSLVINDLHKAGINKFSIIMRHSARHYDTDFQKEPFMSLTEEGRNLAFRLGHSLPEGLSARFFSSYIGRCIETSYLIDKGYTKKVKKETISNTVSEALAPFYILDLSEIAKIITKQETPVFIRNWIDGKFPESVLKNAKQTSSLMFSFIIEKFKEISENSIDIFISHDWNMFLLKEFGTGLKHEEFGKIKYLEGLVLFEQNGEIFITHHQTKPIPLSFKN